MIGGSITHNSAFRRRRPSSVVFTGLSSFTNFTIPASGVATGSLNGAVPISTTGGTGIFDGVSNWINANSSIARQILSYNLPSGVSVNGTRSLNIRFRNFTLVGSCSVCGGTIVPDSDGLGVYPAAGIGLNAGVAGGGIIQMGVLYNLPGVTFGVPAYNPRGQLSVEAVSSTSYTITLNAAQILSEKNNNLR